MHHRLKAKAHRHKRKLLRIISRDINSSIASFFVKNLWSRSPSIFGHPNDDNQLGPFMLRCQIEWKTKCDTNCHRVCISSSFDRLIEEIISARVCVFIFAYQAWDVDDWCCRFLFSSRGIFKLEILSLLFISVVSIYTWTITVWQVCCLVSISTAALSVSPAKPRISVRQNRSELKSIKRHLANFTIAKRTTRC